MKTITAIQTSYLGFKFRSRLEARWASFFTALDIQFWYEPEGFRLSSGELYLPDFYLPEIKYYAEVKPEIFTTPEILKCEDLANDSDHPVLMLDGPPTFKLYDVIYPKDVTGSDPLFTNCLLDIDYHGRHHYHKRRLFSDPGEGFKTEDCFTQEYRDAVYKSRSERFGVHE